MRPDDRSSWRQIRGDLKAAKRDRIQAKILTERVRGVFDDLLGKAAWSPPKDWGRPTVTFPEPTPQIGTSALVAPSAPSTGAAALS